MKPDKKVFTQTTEEIIKDRLKGVSDNRVSYIVVIDRGYVDVREIPFRDGQDIYNGDFVREDPLGARR